MAAVGRQVEDLAQSDHRPASAARWRQSPACQPSRPGRCRRHRSRIRSSGLPSPPPRADGPIRSPDPPGSCTAPPLAPARRGPVQSSVPWASGCWSADGLAVERPVALALFVHRAVRKGVAEMAVALELEPAGHFHLMDFIECRRAWRSGTCGCRGCSSQGQELPRFRSSRLPVISKRSRRSCKSADADALDGAARLGSVRARAHVPSVGDLNMSDDKPAPKRSTSPRNGARRTARSPPRRAFAFSPRSPGSSPSATEIAGDRHAPPAQVRPRQPAAADRPAGRRSRSSRSPAA